MCFSKNAARKLPEFAEVQADVQPASPQCAGQGMATLSALAHDINNMLTNALLHLDCARQQAYGDEVERYLNGATSSLMQVKELIAEARLNTRSQRAPVGPLRIEPTLTNTLEILSNANNPLITLQCRIDPETPEVCITRAELSQIVTNLIYNARRAIASRAGHILILVDFVHLTPGHARLCGGQRGGIYVRIVVSDDGVGMSEETRLRAFEPYVTTKSGQSNTGLGLAIVREIATRREGFVTLCSEPRHGTDVTVFLPAA